MIEESASPTGAAAGRRGSIYILALIALLVGTVLALTMIRACGAYYLSESTRGQKQTALDMAWAGADYAYWQVVWMSQPLPYTAQVTLTTGAFQVTAIDDGARQPGGILITSLGTVGSCGETVKRMIGSKVLSPLPYDYGWCVNGPISSPRVLISTTEPGGIRANGDIDLSNQGNLITTGVWSTGQIIAKGTVTPQYPNSPAVTFPSIDYAYYEAIATRVYAGDTTLTSLDYPAGAVIVVHGDLSIEGIYNGVCTVVATGEITTTGDLNKANSDSFVALISDSAVRIAQNSTIEAVVYCHNSLGDGTIELKAPNTAMGSLAGDIISPTATVTLGGDPGLTRDMMTQLHLPGA